MLVGNRAPHRKQIAISDAERAAWNNRRAKFDLQASHGMGVGEALRIVRNPAWRWNDDMQGAR
jgi:hypothetical protein